MDEYGFKEFLARLLFSVADVIIKKKKTSNKKNK